MQYMIDDDDKAALQELRMLENSIDHYEADLSLMGDGCLCGHRHRTPEAAQRCLPRTPSGDYFSMAGVHSIDAHGSDITNALARHRGQVVRQIMLED